MAEPPKQKRRFGPQSPPRWRLPVRHRGFWAGSAVGLVLSALLVTGTLLHRSSGRVLWQANSSHLHERLTAAGLPALPVQGVKVHIHQHLDIFVDGKRIAVPGGIGIGPGAGFYSPIHTHDTSGIVHVESPTNTTYTLGQFFGVWGVRLTARCLDGYCNTGPRKLRTFVDGMEFFGDPAGIRLSPHLEIVLAFGIRSQLPKPIPSSYSFPSGL